MKKIFIMMVLAAAAMNANAQLVVDSLGRVGIGTEAPISILSVGSNGVNDAAYYFYTNDRKSGVYSVNYSHSSSQNEGFYSKTRNYVGNTRGIGSYTMGSNNINLSQTAIGLGGYVNYASTCVGVFGGRIYGSYSPVNYAGVFGSESGNIPYFSNYSDSYAGFFDGKVRVTNGIYATVLSPVTGPSPSGQDGLPIVSDRGESVSDKLSRVQTLQYFRYDPTKESATAKVSADDWDIDNMSPSELDSLAEAMGNVEPEPYLSPVQYGLAADQLKAVYPELVYEDVNGNVSINYVEMVPLLVQSINELKSELAELKGTSAKKAKAEPTAIEEIASDVDMVRMDQNKPNPFSESTVITLNIPQQAQSASIFIYDMSGKQVQSITVSERGETNITVYASDLTAGMYIYTLVVDGKAAVTRRMIVEK